TILVDERTCLLDENAPEAFFCGLSGGRQLQIDDFSLEEATRDRRAGNWGVSYAPRCTLRPRPAHAARNCALLRARNPPLGRAFLAARRRGVNPPEAGATARRLCAHGGSRFPGHARPR